MKKVLLFEEQIRPEHEMAKHDEVLKRDISFLRSNLDWFERVNCYLCGSSKSRLFLRKKGFVFVRCTECGTVFMNPRPSIKLLKLFYQKSANYQFWLDSIISRTEVIRKEEFFMPRIQILKSLCKEYNIARDSALDIGAGYGAFCELLQRENLFDKISGIEPSTKLAEYCKEKGLDVANRTIEEYTLKKEKFDVITAFEVIEHLYDPGDFLFRIYQGLRSGGILMLSCPNINGFDVLSLGSRSNVFCHEHLNYFTPQTISRLLEKFQYHIVALSTPGTLDVDIVKKAFIKKELSKKANPFLYNVIMKETDECREAFQKYLNNNLLSSHMLIIARK